MQFAAAWKLYTNYKFNLIAFQSLESSVNIAQSHLQSQRPFFRLNFEFGLKVKKKPTWKQCRISFNLTTFFDQIYDHLEFSKLHGYGTPGLYSLGSLFWLLIMISCHPKGSILASTWCTFTLLTPSHWCCFSDICQAWRHVFQNVVEFFVTKLIWVDFHDSLLLVDKLLNWRIQATYEREMPWL